MIAPELEEFASGLLAKETAAFKERRDMFFLLLAHLSTHSIPRTVGQTSSGG